MPFNATVPLHNDQKKLLNDVWDNKSNYNRFISALHNIAYYFTNIVNFQMMTNVQGPRASPSRQFGYPPLQIQNYPHQNSPRPNFSSIVSNRFSPLQDLQPEQMQASPEQTATGKGISNPLKGVTFPKSQSQLLDSEDYEQAMNYLEEQLDSEKEKLADCVNYDVEKEIRRRIEEDGFSTYFRIQEFLDQQQGLVSLEEDGYDIICDYGIYLLRINLEKFRESIFKLDIDVDASYLWNKGLISTIEVKATNSLEDLDKFNFPNRLLQVEKIFNKKYPAHTITCWSSPPEWTDKGLELTPYQIIFFEFGLTWHQVLLAGPRYEKHPSMNNKMELARRKSVLIYRVGREKLHRHFNLLCQGLYYEVWSHERKTPKRLFHLTDYCEQELYTLEAEDMMEKEEALSLLREDQITWEANLTEEEIEAIDNRADD